MSPAVPRVFLVRHGETEWSLDGRHTGVSDIPLTPNGEKRIRATGRALVGPDRLIVPGNLAAVFVSPRKRAQRTLQLLVSSSLQCSEERLPNTIANKTETRPDIQEWNYGAYEGITTPTINEERARLGEQKWDIWRDGCPEGESPEDVTKRCDKVIKEIRERFHAPAMESAKRGSGGKKEAPACDVMLVAHGHILRSFAARWVGQSLRHNPSLVLEAGGIGTLSYEHHNIDEPAIMLGGAFVVDAIEHVEALEKANEKKGYRQAPLGV